MAETNQDLIKKYKDLLKKSPTAYSPGASPTETDIYNQRQLQKYKTAEQVARDKYLKDQWYTERGTENEEAPQGRAKGPIGDILHAVQTPFYGVVGAIETALGKGSKKGLLENIGANIEEEGCYDEKTEILTHDGWKFFRDVVHSDSVATLNPATDELEYQTSSLIVKYDNKKELVRIDNRAIDIAVTPNHNMYVSTLTVKNKEQVYKPYGMIKAKELPNTQIKIKRNCRWNAKDKNKYPRNWFAIMGLYVSEGCLANHGTAIHLSVHKTDVVEKTKKMLNKSDFKYSLRKGGGFDVFVGKELAAELKKLGTASEKYIPDYVKFSSSSNIRIFLEWFSYGDGHERNGFREFYSSSKKLIDDLQECLIKTGKNGNINIRDRRGTKVFIAGHWANCNYLAYELNERVKKTVSYINGLKDVYLEKYNGSVYCVEVPNHILLVRRNGKPYFCGNTMGDLMRSYGITNLASFPIGLALDIALDPLTYASLGTSVLPMAGIRSASALSKLPKMAKLGAESKLLGAGSSVLGAGTKVAEGVSGLGKKLGVDTSKLGFGKFSGLQKTIEEKASKAAKEYDVATGFTVENIAKYSQRDRLLDKLSRKMDESDFGRSLKGIFEYSSKKQVAKSMDEDTAALLRQSKEQAEAMNKTRDSLFKRMETMTASEKEALNIQIAMEKEAVSLKKFSREIEEEIDNIKVLFENDAKALREFTGLSEKNMEDFAKTMRYYKIELAKYDEKVAKVMLNPTARKLLHSYAVYTGWFKAAKIGGNLLAAGVNALVGNLAMTSMAGVNIASSGFAKSMQSAIKITISRDAKHLKPFVEDDRWMEAIRQFSNTFEGIFGLKAEFMQDSQRYVRNFVTEARASGKYKNSDIDAFEEGYRTLVEGASVIPGLRRTVGTVPGGETNTFLSKEIFTGPFNEFLENAKKGGLLGSEKLGKAFYAAVTSSMEAYNKTDQTYRIALALNLSKEGITKSEFLNIAKRFRINIEAKDVVEVGNKVKFSPVKSMEIAQSVYMNYAAMPKFVQAMRTLPLVGHPFISFTYGMGSIATETALYNPMFYNKVSYLLHEISGQKSPLEKQALESGYYDWMNKPGMVKVPFFEDNPLYLNVANMIPHYTMSILQPSERNYKNRFGGTLANLIDKTPFFKTPDGQIMLDYVIMPSILQGERPQGMFGQPLWEKDAGLLRKTGYATRTFLESLTPPMAGYLGGGTLAGLPPEGAIEYVPSYRFRGLANAVRGRSNLGISTKEPATEKTAKLMATMAGFPLYSVKPQYSESKKKK